jgi:Tfp pilus assembly protein PilO
MEKYILQLGDMTWSKVIIGGLIAAGAYWGLYYDDGSTLETAIQTLNSTYTESERQLRETKDAMADAEKFEKAVRQNEIQFEKVLEYLPQEINANELTRMVNTQAAEATTRVQMTKAIEVVEKKDFYEMTRLEFSLQGTFSGVVGFLSLISKIPRLLTFDKLQIKMLRSGEDIPSVELSGVLVGYRYLKEVDPAAAAPGTASKPTGAPSGTNP